MFPFRKNFERKKIMANRYFKKTVALLLTLCIAWGCMLFPGALAAELRDLVPTSTLSSYGPDGNPKENPFGDIGTVANVSDGNSNTIWGWGAEPGMHLISDFGSVRQISSIYVETKEEGTPNEAGEYGLYKIETRGADGNWTVVEESVPAKTAGQGGFTHTFDQPVSAKAVKVTIAAWYTESWAGISELRVMGVSDNDIVDVIESGSEWQYYYYTTDSAKNAELGLTWNAELPADWNTAGVDTTGWLTGAAPFCGDSYPNASAKTHIAVSQDYELHAVFAKTFTVESAASVTALTMGLYYDQDPVVYLNGRQIFTAGGWNNTLSNYNVSEYKDALVDGENVIAVSMVNTIGGGGFNFDLRLTAQTTPLDIYEGEKVIINHAAHNGFLGDIAKPENMYDGDSNTCSGKGFDGDNYFEFYFNGVAEINYIYLELKNEGQTERTDGIYGHYKLLAMNEAGEYETVLTQIPIYPGTNHMDSASVPDGMNGCYVKLDTPLNTKSVRVEVEDWYAGNSCWANISEFGAWRTLDACTVTFKSGDEIVAKHVVPTGSALHSLMVPAVPEKDGKEGTWSVTDFTSITADTEVTAEYPADYIGDMDGNGKLTIRDVSRLLMHLADGNVTLHEPADVDGDGQVNIADATALLMKLAG